MAENRYGEQEQELDQEEQKQPKRFRTADIEKYKKNIISVFQKTTIIVYLIMMVMFFICVYGVIDARDGSLGWAFALLLILVSLMSIVVYTPRIVNTIGGWIMALMKKLGKEERVHAILFSIVFSMLPILLYATFVGLLSFFYLFM
ncbi:MAG: hypothetical protein E7340_01760 [Clostridiales bacterium]|nr:hypothetical protein [Clostridiales bacterium]